MKKILYSLAVLSCAALTSCDMDTTNFGVIGSENALETYNDAVNFTNGLYLQITNVAAGAKYSAAELQMDKFVGSVTNGNRNGSFSAGQVNSSDQDITAWYEIMYDAINSANYFLPRIDPIIEKETDETRKLELQSFRGVAHFTRAFAYWYLFDKHVNYKEADLDAPGKGLQIVETYNPTGDRKTYVGRSTIRETVAYINKELEQAYADLKAWEDGGHMDAVGPEAAYLSSYTVEALHARFALLCNDYNTALAKAEDVINSGYYELCNVDSYRAMWTKDQGTELLFVPYATKGIGGYNIGGTWITANLESSDYLPTAAAYTAYSAQDIRRKSFFTLHKLNDSGYTSNAIMFTKFFGNPELYTTTSNNLVNKAKPFRLSELYLIAAESAAATSQEGKANGYLNDLRRNRINNYEDITMSGSNLVNAIRDERAKELIGEGFRMSDLRRWGLGFTRVANFSAIGSIFADTEDYIATRFNNVSYQPGDYRYVWPIPYREMSVNPQLTGQQNPGY